MVSFLPHRPPRMTCGRLVLPPLLFSFTAFAYCEDESGKKKSCQLSKEEDNTNTYLIVCVAYTSSHEIPRSIYEACQARVSNNDGGDDGMRIKVVPGPDILVRSSGETRLSNLLQWQTGNSLLYSPKALWPEMGLGHVVWGIFKYKRNYYYLEKNKKHA
ncbi:hypothetical protein L6452_13922 [Arctium lappa]|uniref:Uncharacterized protein n=1 Tax=Arctium lappa TaxID=4217 RepID=A0ACB9CJG1_ARCLA|nr:hypothetical protein L6452_13922 [Arctium lappa]